MTESPLRSQVRLFSVRHFFTKVRVGEAHSEVSPPQREYTIYAARAERHYPEWLILDKDGFIRGEGPQEVSLVPLGVEEIRRLLQDLPERLRQEVRDIALSWGWRPVTGREPLTESDISRLNIFIAPVPVLRDPSYLREKDWSAFIDELVAFASDEVDPDIMLLRRAHLFRGLDPFLNPHAILVTNGGTGKSTFYEIIGWNIGKATYNLLGYAKSPREIFPGPIDGFEEPIGIDQIESQSAPQILRFMFNCLERGWDQVIAGGVRFTVKTRSIFALLANTFGEANSPEKSFATLLDHISHNPAIGRRFPLIIYGNSFRRIKRKPLISEVHKWLERKREFRAVEEFCWARLQRIVHDEKTWAWLNTSMPEYEREATELVSVIEDDTVRTLLEESVSGAQARLRAAGLYAALADHLAEIALGDFDPGDPSHIEALLEDAAQYLRAYVRINLESFGRLSNEYAKELSARRRVFFEQLPEYLKEVVSAVELWRRSKPQELTTLLEALPYRPASRTYTTLQQCVRKIGKKATRDLEGVKRHFSIDIAQDKYERWTVTLLSRDPVPEIKPLGVLEEAGRLG